MTWLPQTIEILAATLPMKMRKCFRCTDLSRGANSPPRYVFGERDGVARCMRCDAQWRVVRREQTVSSGRVADIFYAFTEKL